jgi:hypothetical protein
MITTLQRPAAKVGHLIEGGLSGAGLSEKSLTQGSIALATPLFTYQRLASKFPPNTSTSFEIDADAVTTRLVDLVPMVNGQSINPLTPISAAYRAYRNERFPSSPLLNAAGIQIRNDEDSPLVEKRRRRNDDLGCYSALGCVFAFSDL